MTAQTFGRYEIKKQLGRGGMATVYLAHDPRFGRDVALKVLPPQFLHEEQFRARFEREAKTIAMLEHKAIVPVYDFGEHDGQPYLVMRYMTGGTLEDKVRREGLLSPEETVRIVRSIAAALDAAHSKGIVHRDLKPANILFDHEGDAYLSDFGIVKLSEATAHLTGNAIVGTPAYMSPEQVHGKQNVDGRSDIYTLGVILYELLIGQTPYAGDTPTQVMMAHVLEPVPNLLEVKQSLPTSLNHIVQTAMAKDVEQRYRTAGDMAIALEKAMTGAFPRPFANDATMVAADPIMTTTPMPMPIPTGISAAAAQPTPLPVQPTPPPVTFAPGQPIPFPSERQPQNQTGSAKKWALWGCGAPVIGVLALIGLCVVGTLALGTYVSSLVDETPTPEVIAVVEETPLPTNEPAPEPTAEPTLAPEEPTAEPTPEPTAEPTEEPTAVPTAEPTAIPTSPPVTVGIPAGTMLYKSDFSRLGDWPDGIIDDADDPTVVGAELEATGGAYVFSAYSPNTFFWVTSGQEFGAAVYQVETTAVSGPLDNAFGMLLMSDNVRDNFYRFEISSDGYMRIYRCDDGCSEAEPLVSDGWVATDAIEQGLNQVNVLRVDAEDGQLIFYINGIEVAKVRDNNYTSGDIGLFVNTQDEGDVVIHFDNFYVVEP